MAKLERYTARLKGSAGASQVRASNIGALSDTGAGQVARATAGLGRDIQQASRTLAAVEDKKLEIDAQTQYNRVTSNAKAEAKLIFDEAKKRETPSEMHRVLFAQEDKARFNDFFAEQMKGVSERGKQKIDMVMPEITTAFDTETRRVTTSKWADFQVDEGLKVAQSYVAEGDIEMGLSVIDRLEADGLITAKSARTEKARLTGQAYEVGVGTAQASAFLAWQATITEENPEGDMSAALDSIAKDPRVAEQDKQETENEVQTRINNRIKEVREAVDVQREADRGTINNSMYIDRDYGRALKEINESSLDEKEKKPLLKEASDRAGLAASGFGEINKPAALDAINTAIKQVGNNTLPLKDAQEIYNKNKAGLKSETAVTKLNELSAEFDSSVDSASAKVYTNVRQRAVGKTESALDRLLEALVGVKPDDEKALKERITTARDKFNLELDNFNRWEDSQTKWRQTNPDASPDEILREGMRAWYTEFAGKDTKQLRLESAQAVKKLNEVRVESPDGRTGMIPRSQLKKAIEQGWKKL